MRRTRMLRKRNSPISQNKNEPKKKKNTLNLEPKVSDESSSESDIENYLKSAAEIDLNSTFFNTTLSKENGFDKIEKGIFTGIDRLSDSDPENDVENGEKQFKSSDSLSERNKTQLTDTQGISKKSLINFDHIHAYNKKLDDVRKQINIYNAQKSIEENKIDILNMLALGETRKLDDANVPFASTYSSDFESFSDSGKEDWEEVRNIEKVLIPKKGLEVTVELPGNVRKKKGVSLMDVIKRRLNKIKKENQMYIHKVHILCWMAHGNYVNKILSNQNLMGMALSLLPSQQCYPVQRLDISYLEEIVKWYKKTIKLAENIVDKDNIDGKLEELLEKQITKKESYNYKMFVYIFITILRSLGVKCRLVLSLQVEPLRPPSTELCSLSKTDPKSTKTTKTPTTNISKSIESSSSNKKNICKVTSTKKVGHVNSKLNIKSKKLGILKKINFEDMCSSECSGHKPDIESQEQLPETNLTLKASLRKDKKSSTKQNIIKQSKHNVACSEDLKKDTNICLNESKTKEESKSKLTKKHILKEDKRSKNNIKKGSYNKTLKDEETKNVKKSEISSNKDANLRRSIRQKTNTTKKGEAIKNEVIKDKTDVSSIDSHRNIDKLEQKPLKPPCKRSKSLNSNNTAQSDIHQNSKLVSQKKSEIDKNEKVNQDLFKVKIPFKLKSVLEKTHDSKIKEKSKNIPKIFLPEEQEERNSEKQIVPQLDGGNDELSSDIKIKTKFKTKPNLEKLEINTANQCVTKEHPKRLKKLVQYREIDSDEDFQPKKKHNQLLGKKTYSKSCDGSCDGGKSKYFGKFTETTKLDVRKDIVNLINQSIMEEKDLQCSKKKNKRVSASCSSDNDYTPEFIKKKELQNDFRNKSIKVKKRIPMKKDLLEMEKKKQAEKYEKKKKGINVWVEVFAEAEEKWISVDVVKGQVHSIKEIYTRATHPISYILSWDNEGYIKDITKRYCINWNTVTRKLRVDNKWWEKTLSFYKCPNSARNKEEDEDLAKQQLEQPLPTTISEYKDHPLYVLKRHLLKFESIYPPDALILGFVRNEAVYSRDCVHVLHSREIWLKHAKVVKPGEKPYKIVKARPKYDKLSNSIITDQLLEIFGKWQVQDYEPPTAENGIVPRNAFGNVDLFKPNMLPKGTVHLQLPGLNKVARRMNIDCAPAIIGFDFHGGWSHPTFDGFIVCEEYSEQLIAAWYAEQEESEKKAQEKIEKRVYENWKRLIRGLLIRERLKAKYAFGEPSKAKEKSKGLFIKKRKIHSDSESENEK